MLAFDHSQDESNQKMKKLLLAVSTFTGIAGFNGVFADDEKMHTDHHHHEMTKMDTRTSLGLSPEMKQHQLANMRSHVEAIKSIIGLMAEGKFEDASIVAHTMLGLTPEMKEMCGMFNNEKFEQLGLAFHMSGDELGNVLQTRDVNASLRALSNTMQYCVECHAAYRQ